jgi:HEAT repeat protein
MTGKDDVSQKKTSPLRLIAAPLLILALSGCASGGMGSDGMVDPEAPLEKRQKGLARSMRDAQGANEERRDRAAEILPQYGALAVPPLIEMAAAGGLDDRLLAISTLAKMGAESRAALPFLIEALEDKDDFVRLAAAEAVGKIPVLGEGSILALRTALSDSSPFVRNQAAISLLALYSLRLEDNDPFVRVNTVRNLEETGSAGVPLLLEILTGEDTYLRPAAAEILSVTGGGSEEVIEGYIRALTKNQYTLTRRVLQALYELGHRAAPAFPVVSQILQSGDPILTQQAIRTIGSMGPAARSVAPDIMPFLESGDVYTRWQAAKTLLDLGLRPESTIPVLIETLKREDRTYQQSQKYFVFFGEEILPYLLPLLAH